MNLDEALGVELARLDAADLRRTLRPPEDDGALDFASSDYLGLARHPAPVEASRRATAGHGTGARASRLVTGTSREVLRLEEEMAAWHKREAALVFGSGYAAALGTISALVGRGDTVVLDKLAHACLIDAARLSGATVRSFPHNRADKLDALLAKLSPGTGRVLVVTESLFSMDGDVAPLADLIAVKERHGAWLLVDEAHAVGLYAEDGAGLLAQAGLGAQVEVIMGTFSKALGSVGGYLAGSRTLIDWLVQRGRSFVYSTALPPGVIAANRAAVALARGCEGRARRDQLLRNIAHFRRMLPPPWESPVAGAIQPLVCGASADALRLSATLRAAGFVIPAIRYPTVPRHAARLRITLNANHTEAEIDRLTQALQPAHDGTACLTASA